MMTIRLISNKKGSAYQASIRTHGHRITKCFEKKADAQRWLRLMYDKRDHAEIGPLEVPTLKEFVTEWFELRRMRVRPATMKLHEYLLAHHILPNFEKASMKQITPRHLQQLMSKMRENGIGPRVVNMTLHLMKKLYNDAIQEFGYRVVNPAAVVKPLKEAPRKLHFWSDEEIKQFLETVRAHQPENYLIMKFLLNTGSRIGEAYALQWGDVDLVKGLVCIRRIVDRVNHVAQESTKGNKHRFVGLNPGLLNEMKLKKNSELPNEEDLVFPNKAGGIHFHSSFQRRCFDKCIKLAGVRKIRIHDLRHTFAAHFVMNGGSIYDLKQLLGHSEISMTERYAHLAPEYLSKCLSIVNFLNFSKK